MTDMHDDHKVSFLREETIEEAAIAWLREGDIYNRPYFNIVDFVKNCLMKKLRKGLFKIALFDAKRSDKLAYVSFNPLTLNVDREIWQDAGIGEPFARFVVAHEIGHLIFHDAFAQAFSNDPSVRIKAFTKEESAEWQAHTFAYYFLMPTHIVAHHDLEALIRICGVTREIAIARLTLRAPQAQAQSFDGDACSTCGNFTLVWNGTHLICSKCGQDGSV
jgi:hypothetical protein